MLNIHPSLDQVLLVLHTIGEPIRARPGDVLVVRPSDEVYPFVLRRQLPAALVATIPQNAVVMLGARDEEIPHLPPSLEISFAVRAPIGHFGAYPGDELCVRPTDPELPFTLRRSFPLELLPLVPEIAVSLRAAVESVDALAWRRQRDSARARAPSPVRLVG